MLIPVEKSVCVSLLNFVYQVYGKTCFIIFTNKILTELTIMLVDEVLATALLDRLLYTVILYISIKGYIEEYKIFFMIN